MGQTITGAAGKCLDFTDCLTAHQSEQIPADGLQILKALIKFYTTLSGHYNHITPWLCDGGMKVGLISTITRDL